MYTEVKRSEGAAGGVYRARPAVYTGKPAAVKIIWSSEYRFMVDAWEL